METSKRETVFLHSLRPLVLVLLAACCLPPAFTFSSSASSSSALHPPEDFSSPYDSIFSPLFRALSEHGGSRWDPGLRKRPKPEPRYMRYLTEVYKKSSRVQRSVGGGKAYNTVRLIQPVEKCLPQSNPESFMQDLSYSLDQVRTKEQLLKSALLYSFDHYCLLPVLSVCYLSIMEQERSNQCQLCPGAHRVVNITASADWKSRRNWVEVDITSFLQPHLKLRKKNINLFINITCPEEQRETGNEHTDPPQFIFRSPPLLLYLNDKSKIAHQHSSGKAFQRPAASYTAFQKQDVFRPDQNSRRKKRWKRDSPKNKQGDKRIDIQLPELLSSSEFPTTHCALYDFRVRFSQLKLDHWIVFPPKYNPRYCRGICLNPMGSIYGSPVHTMVQTIIYDKLDDSVPRPSCVPSHYSPLSVMISEEDGSIAYKEFEDMIADRCTCR